MVRHGTGQVRDSARHANGTNKQTNKQINLLPPYTKTVFLSEKLLNKPRQRLPTTTHIHVEVSLVDPEQILHGSHACENVANRN